MAVTSMETGDWIGSTGARMATAAHRSNTDAPNKMRKRGRRPDVPNTKLKRGGRPATINGSFVVVCSVIRARHRLCKFDPRVEYDVADVGQHLRADGDDHSSDCCSLN